MYLYFSLIALAEAFVSLATNDGYAKGALVLGQSLRENKTSKKLVLMITNDVTQATRLEYYAWGTRTLFQELRVIVSCFPRVGTSCPACGTRWKW